MTKSFNEDAIKFNLGQNDSIQRLPNINTKFKIESSENDDYSEMKTPLAVKQRRDRMSMRTQSIDNSTLVTSRKMLKPVHNDLSTNISSKLILKQNLRTLNKPRLGENDNNDTSTVNLGINDQLKEQENYDTSQASIEIEELQNLIKEQMLNYPDPTDLDPLEYNIQCIENNFDVMK